MKIASNKRTAKAAHNNEEEDELNPAFDPAVLMLKACSHAYQCSILDGHKRAEAKYFEEVLGSDCSDLREQAKEFRRLARKWESSAHEIANECGLGEVLDAYIRWRSKQLENQK